MTKAAKNVRELEFESISKLMWKYFLPALVGVMMSSLYNVVDRIFIGQGVGAEALSALSAVFPIMIIIVAFGMLIGVGAGVRVSINLGKKDFNRAELVLGNAFVMMLIISVLITGIGLGLKEPLLRFFGVGQATFDYAVEYIDIILWSAVFQVVGYSLNNIIRSEGNAKVAMFSMIITSVLNMLLDPLFIFVFDMGVAGAAYATVLSQVALCVWTIYHFRSKKSVIKLDIAKFKLSGEIIWYIVTIGFSSFMMQLASSLVFGTFNVQLVKYGGDIAVGALGILMSVAMIIIFTCIAINLAGQPIISFNHGANLPARVKQTLLTGMWWATVVCVVGFVLTQIFPHAIIKAFNKDNKELLEVGERGMRLLMFGFPVVGFQIVVANYFQSTAKAGLATVLSLLRQVIFLVPLLWIFPKYYGIDGVWLAGPFSDYMSAIVISVFLVREVKKLNTLIDYKEAGTVKL